MARLESIAKGGYYPIPPEVTQLALQHLDAPFGGRVCDPCAGKGKALFDFAVGLGLEPYGAELNRDRGHEAHQLIDTLVDPISQWRNDLKHKDKGLTRFITEDFQSIETPKGSMQLLYLNPPYDWDKKDGRLEYTFLKRATYWLQPEGVLALVIPQNVVGHRNILDYLASWYDDVHVHVFPDTHYDNFKQVIVFGYKKNKQTAVDKEVKERLQKISVADPRKLTPVGGTSAKHYSHYVLPRPRRQQIKFQGLYINPEEASQELDLYGNHTSLDYAHLFDPKTLVGKRPLMPFKIGHLSGLIYAGGLNNSMLDNDEDCILISGRVLKEIKETVREGEPEEGKTRTVTVQREHARMQLTTLNRYGEIEDVPVEQQSDFLYKWLPQLTEAVNSQYEPVYKFELGRYAPLIGNRATLLSAQKHIVAAVATRLETADNAFIVGEMGTGKTRMGAVLIAATKHRRALIMVPSHLVPKWIRETELSMPEANVMHINTIKDTDQWMELDEKKQIQIGIIKFTSARAASGWKPAYYSYDYFTQEECELIEKQQEDMRELHYADPLPEKLQEKKRLYNKWLQRYKLRGIHDSHMGQGIKNKKGILIGASEIGRGTKQYHHIVQGEKHELSKQRERYVTFYNYTRYKNTTHTYRDFFRRSQSIKESYQNRQPLMGGPPKLGRGRWRIADYIKKQYKNRIGLLIVDEAHMTKGEFTDQGYALARLSTASQQTVLMTGTIYGGKASTVFQLLYRTSKEVRDAYTDTSATGRRRIMRKKWIADYGMLEYTQTVTETSGTNSGNKQKTEHVKEAPGASPAMLPWLLERTAFVSLADMGLELPNYEEIPMPVQPTIEQADSLQFLESVLGSEMRQRLARGDKSLLGIYLQANLCWPDSPWRDEIIIDPHTKGDDEPTVLCRLPALPDKLYPKEREIIELIKDNVFLEGRRVLLLTQQTRIRDITKQWEKKLRDAGLKPVTMNASASTREAWINKQVKNGVNVLLTHPKAVEVGLDLLDFPTVIWMGTEYSVYTILQASRRPYRIGQDKPVRIYFFYYEDTLQEKAIDLIARKCASSIRVNGDVIADTDLAASEANTIEDALGRMILDNEDSQVTLVHEMFKDAKASMQETSSFIGDYEIQTPEDEPDNIVVVHPLPDDRPTSLVTTTIGELPPDASGITATIEQKEEQVIAVSMEEPTAAVTESPQMRLVFGMSLAPTKTKKRKKANKKPQKATQISLFDRM
ncbi:DEAD/DEAH box helicase family protein [Candidatus Pacearchaeota archaeon]|nr:DEAD/DEAH box helicase family protein [Candidatus Pacearchaeota archaeon]